MSEFRPWATGPSGGNVQLLAPVLPSAVRAQTVIRATVVASVTRGLLIDVPQGRMLLEGAPNLAAGSSIDLQPTMAGSTGRSHEMHIIAVSTRPLTVPIVASMNAQPLATNPSPPIVPAVVMQGGAPLPGGQSIMVRINAVMAAGISTATSDHASATNRAVTTALTPATEYGGTRIGQEDSGTVPASQPVGRHAHRSPTTGFPPAPDTGGPRDRRQVASLTTSGPSMQLLAAQTEHHAVVRTGGTSPTVVVPATHGAKALPPGATVEAEVLARDAVGRLMLRTLGMTLRLERPDFELPAGTRVILGLPSGWPSLADHSGTEPGAEDLAALVRMLQTGERASLNDGSLRHVLPRPEHALAAQILGWLRGDLPAIAAARNHDNANAARHRPNAGTTPGREAVQDLTGPVRENSASGWRTMFVPVLDDGDLSRLAIHIHKDDDGGTTAGDDPASRAIFEIAFSRLGRIQVDVLSRNRRLDMQIRSERPLAIDQQEQIRSAFDEALALGNWQGGIGFGRGTFVTIDQGPKSHKADTTA